MILSKQDLLEYLEADKKNLNRGGVKPSYYDLIWRFEIALRRCEYYANCGKTPLD